MRSDEAHWLVLGYLSMRLAEQRTCLICVLDDGGLWPEYGQYEEKKSSSSETQLVESTGFIGFA